jgi:hypothetical protein
VLIEKRSCLIEGGEFRLRVIELSQPAHLLDGRERHLATQHHAVNDCRGLAFARYGSRIETELREQLALRFGHLVEVPFHGWCELGKRCVVERERELNGIERARVAVLIRYGFKTIGHTHLRSFTLGSSYLRGHTNNPFLLLPPTNIDTYRARGREFTQPDIELIKRIVVERFTEGRWRISLAVCEALNWFQENGWPKDRACRDILNIFDRAGVIQLPKRRSEISVSGTDDLVQKYYKAVRRFTHPDVVKGQLRAVLAKSDANEKTWNQVVQEHHYLGHTVQVGRTLKFLLYRTERLIGAFALSDAAYNVAPRDQLLKVLGYVRQDVVNNSRLLLIPSESEKNDASRTLAILAQCARIVWPAYYGRSVKVIETFVDSERFIGTSYKAANWLMIGHTRGYRKSGASFSNGQSSKMIFVYPLDSNERDSIAKGMKT